MANNYLVCRANLIQDLELILRDQQLLLVVAMAVVLFSVRWRIYQSQCYCWLCRGWHCDILWLCNRPSFHPLLVVLQFTLLLSSLSLLEHNLLHCIYCDNVSRGWMKEGGRALHILFICCFDTHIIPKRSEREGGAVIHSKFFQDIGHVCEHVFSSPWITFPQFSLLRRCFVSKSDSSLTNSTRETKSHCKLLRMS